MLKGGRSAADPIRRARMPASVNWRALIAWIIKQKRSADIAIGESSRHPPARRFRDYPRRGLRRFCEAARRTTLPDDIRRALPDHGMSPSEWPHRDNRTSWQKIPPGVSRPGHPHLARGRDAFVMEASQTYGRLRAPGFKDPAREMPTPPSEDTPLRAALRRHLPAYFAAGWQLGMKGKFSNRHPG